MIFWRVTKLLDRLPICFLLFDFSLWKRCQMAKALRCSLHAGVRRAGSNPVLHRKRCGHRCQAQNYFCKLKLKLLLEHSRFISFFLMKHVFIQKTQVWARYFKLFNRVQLTQDEKAHFIKGNELNLTRVELFSFLFFKRAENLLLKSSLTIKLQGLKTRLKVHKQMEIKWTHVPFRWAKESS